MKKQQLRHWYKTICYECPVCGKSEIYRMRVYGEKPTDYIPEIHQMYDWCNER